MSDHDLSWVLEPVRLLFSERLFSAAHPEALPNGTEVLTDLDRAMLLENSQELPREYRIWQDVQANAVSPFYCTDAYATISMDPVLEALFQVYHAGFYPCGWRRGNHIVCFDPSVLEGHGTGCLLDYPV
ncbi:hypothetical protein [Alcanivorax sp. 24]|uniref:hypothetical protein n=1 Tax=Alcanivorax sp. 24 TaxID=2545266 RepID=UPI00105F62F0|nr:hypothetical protein [Alcanivorax sp. 24]